MSESDVLRSIAALLDVHPAVGKWWRCPAGKVKVRGAWMQLAPAGTADITVVLRGSGKYLGVEVKRDDKKSTTSVARRELQSRFAREIEAIGGRVIQVSSATALSVALNEILTTERRASGT